MRVLNFDNSACQNSNGPLRFKPSATRLLANRQVFETQSTTQAVCNTTTVETAIVDVTGSLGNPFALVDRQKRCVRMLPPSTGRLCAVGVK